jgi:hypothetical protein
VDLIVVADNIGTAELKKWSNKQMLVVQFKISNFLALAAYSTKRARDIQPTLIKL